MPTVKFKGNGILHLWTIAACRKIKKLIKIPMIIS